MDDTTPPTTTRRSRRPLLIGAVIGAMATAGSVVGVGALAGAQDAPPESLPMATDAGEPEHAEELPFPDEADWAEFDSCMAEQLGDLWLEPDFDDTTERAFEDADAACASLLPEEVQEDMDAWEAFDECLAERLPAWDEPDFDIGAVVHVETGYGFETVEFGDDVGTVTITGTADGVTVSTDGDVTVFDEAAMEAEWEAFDAAHQQCEQLIP